jgi:outer membrane receptor for ferric coprogen and ferric-rhodotorulic acid
MEVQMILQMEYTRAKNGTYKNQKWNIQEPKMEHTRTKNGTYKNQKWNIQEPKKIITI